MVKSGLRVNTDQNPENELIPSTHRFSILAVNAMISCVDCNQPYPSDSIPYRCPSCDGLYDFNDNPRFDPDQLTQDPGIWRYKHFFGLPDGAPMITLGEGDTSLIWSTVKGKKVGFKLEYSNPTHSFKDRGTAVLFRFLASRGVREAMDDSSGNAGSSFAAYAARAEIKARVYVPAYASGPKRDQIEAYGAELVPIPGPRSKASEAVRIAADQGGVYASHALLPHGFPGYSTVAFELVEQIGEAPGAVILPVGQGNLLLALDRGFRMLASGGIIPSIPKLVGVQARVCAPLWAAFKGENRQVSKILEAETLAEGVSIREPYRKGALLQTVIGCGGQFIAVDENAILSGQRQLAIRGMFVEPTSAIVWDALEQIIDTIPDPVIVILTGSGLKAV